MKFDIGLCLKVVRYFLHSWFADFVSYGLLATITIEWEHSVIANECSGRACQPRAADVWLLGWRGYNWLSKLPILSLSLIIPPSLFIAHAIQTGDNSGILLNKNIKIEAGCSPILAALLSISFATANKNSKTAVIPEYLNEVAWNVLLTFRITVK